MQRTGRLDHDFFGSQLLQAHDGQERGLKMAAYCDGHNIERMHLELGKGIDISRVRFVNMTHYFPGLLHAGIVDVYSRAGMTHFG